MPVYCVGDALPLPLRRFSILEFDEWTKNFMRAVQNLGFKTEASTFALGCVVVASVVPTFLEACKESVSEDEADGDGDGAIEDEIIEEVPLGNESGAVAAEGTLDQVPTGGGSNAKKGLLKGVLGVPAQKEGSDGDDSADEGDEEENVHDSQKESWDVQEADAEDCGDSADINNDGTEEDGFEDEDDMEDEEEDGDDDTMPPSEDRSDAQTGRSAKKKRQIPVHELSPEHLATLKRRQKYFTDLQGAYEMVQKRAEQDDAVIDKIMTQDVIESDQEEDAAWGQETTLVVVDASKRRRALRLSAEDFEMLREVASRINPDVFGAKYRGWSKQNPKAYMTVCLQYLRAHFPAVEKWIARKLDESSPLFDGDTLKLAAFAAALRKASPEILSNDNHGAQPNEDTKAAGTEQPVSDALTLQGWEVINLPGVGQIPFRSVNKAHEAVLRDFIYQRKLSTATQLDRRFASDDFDPTQKSRMVQTLHTLRRIVQERFQMVRPASKDRDYPYKIGEHLGQEVSLSPTIKPIPEDKLNDASSTCFIEDQDATNFTLSEKINKLINDLAHDDPVRPQRALTRVEAAYIADKSARLKPTVEVDVRAQFKDMMADRARRSR